MSKSKIEVDVSDNDTIGAKWEQAGAEIALRTENRELKKQVARLKIANLYLKGCYDGSRGVEPRKIDDVEKDDVGFSEVMRLWKEKGWEL